MAVVLQQMVGLTHRIRRRRISRKRVREETMMLIPRALRQRWGRLSNNLLCMSLSTRYTMKISMIS